MDIAGVNVKITADSKGFKSAMDSASKVAGEFGGDLSKMVGMLTGPAGIAVAAAAAAAAIVKASMEWESATVNMVKRTGATTKEVEAFDESLRKLVSNGVEQSLQEFSAGMVSVGKSFDLSQAEIEQTTMLFAEFSDIVGGEMRTNVEDISQAMKKWNLDSSQLPETLDKIVKTTQISNISSQELIQTLTQGATQFQGLGISIDEAAGMLAAFDKAGVKIPSVMTGMNTALAFFASNSIDASSGFDEVIKRIQNAPNEMQATSIAIKVFGQRAGPELAKAFKESGPELAAFVKAIGQSEGTIENTAKNTGELADSLAKAGNIFKETLAALTGSEMKGLQGVVEGLGKALAFFVDAVIEGVRAAFSPLVNLVKFVVDLVEAVIDLIQGDWEGLAKNLRQMLVDLALTFAEVFIRAVNVIVDALNVVLTPFKKEIPKVGTMLLNTMNKWADGTEKTNKKVVDNHNKASKATLAEWEKAGDKISKADDSRLDNALSNNEEEKESEFSLISLITQERSRAMAEVAQKEKELNELRAENLARYTEQVDESLKAQISMYSQIASSMAGFASSDFKESASALASFGSSLASVSLGDMSALPELLKSFVSLVSEINSGAGQAMKDNIDGITKILLKLFKIMAPFYEILWSVGGALLNLVDAGLELIVNFIEPAIDFIDDLVSGFRDFLVYIGLLDKTTKATGDLAKSTQAVNISIKDFLGTIAAINQLPERLSKMLKPELIQKFAASVAEEFSSTLASSLNSANTAEEFRAAINEMIYGMAVEAVLVSSAVAPLLAQAGSLIANALVDGVISTDEATAIQALSDQIYAAASGQLGGLSSLLGIGSSSSSGFSDTEDLVSGSISSFANGVRNFSGGLAMVGEQGPELVSLPRGSSVYNSSDTRSMSVRGSATINITSPVALDAISARRAFAITSRRLAYEGAL